MSLVATSTLFSATHCTVDPLTERVASSSSEVPVSVEDMVAEGGREGETFNVILGGG